MVVVHLEHGEFRHDLHIAMWDWLSKNPGYSKKYWINEVAQLEVILPLRNVLDGITFEDYCYCFACVSKGADSFSCANCPFENQVDMDNCLSGLYHQWKDLADCFEPDKIDLVEYSKFRTEMVELAIKIRDFKVKEK